jgi:hypothetical protein
VQDCIIKNTKALKIHHVHISVAVTVGIIVSVLQDINSPNTELNITLA